MKSAIDILFLRRPPLDYVCPPVCEVEFSSSASPVIVLDDIDRLRAPSGLILGGEGGVRLSWDAYPGALCYSLYRADDPLGEFVLVAECIPDTFYILSPGYYRVTAITPDGETDPSVVMFGGGFDCGCPDGIFETCPNDIDDLIGWYAADCIHLADGTEVETWGDLAESMGDATKEPTDGGPIFKTNIFGSRPAIHFTGNRSLVIPACPVFGEFTVLAVTKCPGQVTVLGNPATGDYYLRTAAHPLAASGDAQELHQGSSSRGTRQDLNNILSDKGMIAVRRRDVFLDQKTAYTENYVYGPALAVLFDLASFQFTRIGVGGFAYTPNDGYIAEICVWDRQLTDEEITDLFDNYFQPKYDL